MSYVRWAQEDSNVYIYGDGCGKYCCCVCGLDPDGKTFRTDTSDEMVTHLHKHQEVGHTVPQFAIDRLEAEDDSWTEELHDCT